MGYNVLVGGMCPIGCAEKTYPTGHLCNGRWDIASGVLLGQVQRQTKKKPQDMGSMCYGGRPKAVPANLASCCGRPTDADQLQYL